MSPVYRSYTGVDISDAALRIAAQRAASSAREQVRFVQGFMHSYVPDSKPDVFLFRESLQYVSRNRKQARKELCTFLSRYADMLRANGVIIARLCADGSDAQRYAKTLEMIVREHFVLRECRWTQDPSALLIAFCPDVTR